MTRLRTDQACLEAQMQQQIAQNLNAELAVPCPDCFSPAGLACRDSLDRAVRTHLARSVAANRRDTEPCPAPSESLERASARAFAESIERSREEERLIGERVAKVWARVCEQVAKEVAPEPPRIKWLETAQAGGDFFAIDKTPTASDCAPAIAPEAVASTQPTAFPVEECGGCSRPLKSGAKKFGELFGPPLCGDCAAERVRAGKPAPLDKRIREAQPDDATECAWSTPTSDGEGWT